MQILESIEDLLEDLLPTEQSLNNLEDIDNQLRKVRDDIEKRQSFNNDYFDEQLVQFVHMSRSLHNTQLDFMKLQCEIALAKEQFEIVKETCDNPLVHARRELLIKEEDLKKALRHSKFAPVKEFFEKFADHLKLSIETCRRSFAQNVSNYIQFFDWTQYHQTMFLLKACGKTLMDIERFERLYQSDLCGIGMSFKHPIERSDFKRYIDSHKDTYSLESQLEVWSDTHRRQDYKDILLDSTFGKIVDSQEATTYIIFGSHYHNIKSLTVDCCRLLVELNMNYIEAHLTDGINIDKLNSGEEASLQPEEQSFPIYAMSPQEYITQIGQHLLTLRKQTEQFDGHDHKALRYGLELLGEAQDIPISVKSYNSVTEIVMRCIARHCIRSLLGRTGHSIMSKLSLSGRRQLATDALYLDNVLEDLGLLNSEEPNVNQFKNLLVHH